MTKRKEEGFQQSGSFRRYLLNGRSNERNSFLTTERCALNKNAAQSQCQRLRALTFGESNKEKEMKESIRGMDVYPPSE